MWQQGNKGADFEIGSANVRLKYSFPLVNIIYWYLSNFIHLNFTLADNDIITRVSDMIDFFPGLANIGTAVS